jgi:hypothetical protein
MLRARLGQGQQSSAQAASDDHRLHRSHPIMQI